MKTGFYVGEAMTVNPVVVTPDTTLLEAAEIMERSHVGSLVVKEKDKLVGIATEQDLVRKGLVKNKKSGEIKIREVMETDLRTITTDNDVFDALQMMRDYNIRHLPVVEKGKLVGLVTTKDILKIQPDLFEILAEKIHLREEERKPVWTPGEEEGLCQACGKRSLSLKEKDEVLMCRKCRQESQ
ncbi:CBS domain-containing protein [Candidatus Woesearchaeota archaeon]|nr:CBS domain-containing protein [Candidatus Woesearchaeota archaeon]